LVSLNAISQTVVQAVKPLQDHYHQHPKIWMASFSAVLLCTGATAFAVANYAPDVSDLPVREVVQAVEPLQFDNSPVFPDYKLYRSDTTRPSDTADTLLRRLAVLDAGAAAFLRNDANAKVALSKAGRAVQAETDSQQRLSKLTARWTPDDTNTFQRLVVERSAAGPFVSRIETAPLTASTRLASGVIRSSLFAATDDARVPDAVAVQIAEIFSGDIDFHRELRKGDRFSVVYETLEADGEPLRAGRVISAEFVNGGKAYNAVWYQEPGRTKGEYYTLDGNSMRKAFLASPLEFSRMTSGFGMRMHPIARDWRAHKGVDYAAPTGTPIRTVGDGVVAFAGVQRGYGNVVEIKHRDGKSTLYAHMHSIAVRVGQAVEQGYKIGTVGSTGWSTGPHLHFEFRINGEHQDPALIAKEAGTIPISAAARPAFMRFAGDVRQKLAAASSLAVATAQ
jgi:murein DD-endopeptidase MepM/ murein hydrolase activator NlpD